MKKVVLSMSLVAAAFCADLGSNITDMVVGGLESVVGDFNKYWKEFNKYTNGVADLCYAPAPQAISGDICSILDSLDKLNVDVCSFTPSIPGLTKKSQYIGVSGIKQLCQNQKREFVDIASTTFADFGKQTFGQGLANFKASVDATTLPNGQKLSEYLKTWNINDIIQKDQNDKSAVKKYILNNNHALVSLIMDYSATASARGKAPSDISLEDISKAPKDLLSYKEGIYDLAKTLSDNESDTSAYQIGSAIKGRVDGQNGNPKKAQDYLNKVQDQYAVAKSIDISNALRLARQDSDIAMPTQDYINILREDLKPKAVAQIRKQQLRDAQIVKEINEKWDRKIAINKLIADKEVIMSLEFNEQEAKNKIDAIVSSASSGSGGSLGGSLGGAIKDSIQK